MKEVKKNNNSKIIILVFLAVIFLALGGVGFFYNKNNDTNKDNNIIDNGGISLKDDFFESINHETLSNARIPSDGTSWSKFYDASKTIEKRQEELIEEILADPNYKNEDIDIVLELYNDYDGRNKRKLSELKPYFDMVDKASTIKDFNKALLTIDNDLDVQVLINYEESVDLYDSSKTVLTIQPITIIDLNLEFFTDNRYKNYVPKVENIMKLFFQEMGYSKDKQNSSVKQLLEFAKQVQGKSITLSEVTDLFSIYNTYSLSDITKEVKKIPFKDLFKKLKIDNLDYYVVYDLGHYKALDKYYTEKHLSVLKDLAKLNILNGYYQIVHKDLAKKTLELLNDINGTSITYEENEEDVIRGIKASYIDDEIQKRYEKKYFTDEDKKVVADFVEDVRKYYKDVINKSEWLSDSSKQEALKKLEVMKVNVGYQEKTKEEDKDEFHPISKAKGGTLISNDIASNRITSKNYLKKKQKLLD